MKPHPFAAIVLLLAALPLAAQTPPPPNINIARTAAATPQATVQVLINSVRTFCLTREFGTLSLSTSQGLIKIDFACFPYTCDRETKTCQTGCATNSDCSGGFACVSSKCVVPVPQCNADFTSSVSPFGKADVCYPLVCNQASGLCQQRCRTSADCQAGFACDIDPGVCKKP